MSIEMIIRKTNEAETNPGKPVRVCAGYYLLAVLDGTVIDIERINSNKWVYRSSDSDYFGEASTLKEIVTILQTYVSLEVQIFLPDSVCTITATDETITVNKRLYLTDHNPVIFTLKNSATAAINCRIARHYVVTGNLPANYQNWTI